MADIVLDVEVRERIGTGGARASRREGLVPGVLYGGPLEPVAIALPLNQLKRSLNQGGFLSKLVEIDHKGVRQPVLVRDIQFHPVTATPMHIDLFRVDSDQDVTIEVAVEFVNDEQSPGLKRGGALNVVRHTVELSCRADRIPGKLTVDLTGLDINDTIHISALTLPDGVRPTIQDRDFTIATIVGKGGPSDAEDSEADEGEASEAEG